MSLTQLRVPSLDAYTKSLNTFFLKGNNHTMHETDKKNNFWEKLKYHGPYFLRALIWVVLLMIFSFTEVFMSLLIVNQSFTNTLVETHASALAMIIDFGIIVMLIFDFFISSGKPITKWVVGGILAASFICVLINLHINQIIQGKPEMYIYPLCDNFLRSGYL